MHAYLKGGHRFQWVISPEFNTAYPRQRFATVKACCKYFLPLPSFILLPILRTEKAHPAIYLHTHPLCPILAHWGTLYAFIMQPCKLSLSILLNLKLLGGKNCLTMPIESDDK